MNELFELVETHSYMYLCIILYLFPLRKRVWGYIRIAVGLLIYFPISEILFVRIAGFWDFVIYLVHISLLVGIVIFCCDLKLADAFYCSIWIHCTCDLMYALHMAVAYLPFGDKVNVKTMIYLILDVLMLVCTYFVFVRQLPDNGAFNIDRRHCVQTVALIFPLVIFNNVVMIDRQFASSYILYLCQMLFSVCCILALFFLQSQAKVMRKENERNMLLQVLNERQHQYTHSRESIDLINRKCHDLKHQINAIRQMDTQSRDNMLLEIEDSILTYDAMIETGNEVLNAVLTEKNMVCISLGITMTCRADGKALDFIDAMDLYTIFGNAIDNAIESVRDEDIPEKKIICVIVRKEHMMSMIQIENYCGKQLEMIHGIPISTKEEKGFHGYGIKSIQYTAEKYDGCVLINFEDHLFSVNIMIPCAN